MSDPVHRLLLVSDFQLGNLAAMLRAKGNGIGIEPALAPFGDVVGTLLGNQPEEATGGLVWTRPQAVLSTFRDVLEHREVPPARLIEEVDEFCSLLSEAKRKFRYLLVPTWTIPGVHRGLGMLDLQSKAGLSANLLRANGRLADNLTDVSDTFVFDASRWTAKGEGEEGGRLWYLAKIPFTNAVFREAASDIRAAISGIAGHARKVVILDLDDTLWGGIVGDVGWEALQLGGHDPIGEAYQDFQLALKSLTNRGIVLAIVSKNEEAVALTAINSHPEMALAVSDFAAWRINWDDKARNIAEVAQELNVGLDSLVFIDDSAGERARVREALPDVLVPDWPADPLRYASSLRALRCFDSPTLSKEDVNRARMYGAERERRQVRQNLGSMDEWLRTLGIRITIAELDRSSLQRATQLLNKTNQMNLSTRRLTESELWTWANAEERNLWTVRVQDRFGDYGLTGIVSLEYLGTEGKIVDFVLSCRVFGRQVEETMVYVATRRAQHMECETLYADFKPTQKNKPCLDFWKTRSGFVEQPEIGRFGLALSSDTRLQPPEHIQMIEENDRA